MRLRAHLFDSTVLPALTFASETWTLRKQDERTLNVRQRAVERAMLGVSRITQVRERIRSSELRQRSKIRDASVYAKMSKITRLVTGSHEISSAQQEDHRLDGQTCLRKA